MEPKLDQPWQVCDRFLELHSRWMTLIGEHLQNNQGQVLEYWRVEKADSVIVVPLQGDRFLLPAPSYRPGIGQSTLDFPGGRRGEGTSSEDGAIAILQRELGIAETAITQLTPLNAEGWAINSSFSNQKLYGFVAQIKAETDSPRLNVISYPTTTVGVRHLLEQLQCLQCRAVLLEWQQKFSF